MLEKFDALMLQKTEKYLHWLQKTCGRDCFWLAHACLIMHGLMMTLFVFLSQEYAMLLWMLIQSMHILVKWIKEQAYKDLKCGLANQEKLRVGPRLFQVCGQIYCHSALFLLSLTFLKSSVVLLILCGVFFLVLFYYFIACDPLPPAKSKVKIWLENFAEKAKEILSPAPQPIPIPISNR